MKQHKARQGCVSLPDRTKVTEPTARRHGIYPLRSIHTGVDYFSECTLQEVGCIIPGIMCRGRKRCIRHCPPLCVAETQYFGYTICKCLCVSNGYEITINSILYYIDRSTHARRNNWASACHRL